VSYKPAQPYNALPKLPPKTDLATPAVLKKLVSASRALSELKGATSAGRLPNPNILIDTLTLQEARSSSEIENIITTQDELFKAAVSDREITDANTKEVLHYKDALWHGVQLIRKKPFLTTNLFIELVQRIKQNNAGIRSLPGTQLRHATTRRVIYTPPEGEQRIRDLLKNLEDYLHGDDKVDPLIKLAVMHYQFEAIHPFFDGNGRTGRILLVLYLLLENLLEVPCVYLSKYIMDNRSGYYTCLNKVTSEAQWEPWLLYMLDMIEQSARYGLARMLAIQELMSRFGADVRRTLPKLYSVELIDSLFRLPYCKRRFLSDAGIGNPKTAGNYLSQLEQSGFLKSEQVGKEKLYLNVALMRLLK
jgi:Fic family protein